MWWLSPRPRRVDAGVYLGGEPGQVRRRRERLTLAGLAGCARVVLVAAVNLR